MSCFSLLCEDKSLSGSILNFISLSASLFYHWAKASTFTWFECECIFRFSELTEEEKNGLWLDCSHRWICFQVPLSWLRPPLAAFLVSVGVQMEASILLVTRVLSPACCVWAVWTHWQIWLQAILDAISRNRILSLMRRKKLSGLWGTEKNRKVPKQKEKPARDKDKERALYCHTGRVLRKKVKPLHHLHQHSGYAAVFSWIIGVAAQTKPPHQCWYRRRKSQNQKSRKF